MSAYAFDVAAADMAVGMLRWSEDDIRVVLINSSYEPRQAEDATLADIRDAIVSDAVRLPGRSVDHDSPGRICLRGSGLRFPRGDYEFRYAVIFDANSERLRAYSDLGPQKVTNTIPIVDYPDGEVCELLMSWDGELNG